MYVLVCGSFGLRVSHQAMSTEATSLLLFLSRPPLPRTNSGPLGSGFSEAQGQIRGASPRSGTLSDSRSTPDRVESANPRRRVFLKARTYLTHMDMAH